VARSLADLRREAADCTDCDLYARATQTVFGEGPADAPIVLIGEQPGDHEDRRGRPFVGPAGQLLSRAMDEAGLDRSRVYVTNVVKHFKWQPARGGKVRLHKKPNVAEVRACSQWWQRELEAIRPDVVVLLGATAAQGVLGPRVRVTSDRGRILELPDGGDALVTMHPSAILRLREPERGRELRSLVSDLRVAAAHASLRQPGGRAPDAT
jgi:DNA polymerase